MLFAVNIIACHTSKVSSNATITEKDNSKYLNGTWQLQTLFASDNKWDKQPVLNINFVEKTISGNNGCNSFGGKVTIKGSYIAIDRQIISTKMACTTKYERGFIPALLKINTYTVRGNELELAQGEIVLMKFKRQ